MLYIINGVTLDVVAVPELILRDVEEAGKTEAVVQAANQQNDDEPARKDGEPVNIDDAPEHSDDALFCGNNISYDL